MLTEVEWTMSKATPTAAYTLYLFHTWAILGLGNGPELQAM
jgi:hypothetical protein